MTVAGTDKKGSFSKFEDSPELMLSPSQIQKKRGRKVTEFEKYKIGSERQIEELKAALQLSIEQGAT